VCDLQEGMLAWFKDAFPDVIVWRCTMSSFIDIHRLPPIIRMH
jgi:hypothetical protein